MLKIYFNEKPLFLSETINEELLPYTHHEDTMLIDEFSPHAVNAMLHEMQQPSIHAGVLLHDNLDELKKAVWKKFTVIQAGGGLVYRKTGEILLIFRRGKWDLPKGKHEKGETMEQCALREVEEETGLSGVRLLQHLTTTYHTYHESGKFILKESWWYTMESTDETALVPQTEEDIDEVRWVLPSNLAEPMQNSFPSIRDVLKAASIGI